MALRIVLASVRSGAVAHVRFGSKADMCSANRHVCFVPIADIQRRGTSMQGRNAMGFQCLDDAVKDQSDTHCGDKEADDTGNGIDPHRPQFF